MPSTPSLTVARGLQFQGSGSDQLGCVHGGIRCRATLSHAAESSRYPRTVIMEAVDHRAAPVDVWVPHEMPVLPTLLGRMALSTRLVSNSCRPSLRYRTIAGHRPPQAGWPRSAGFSAMLSSPMRHGLQGRGRHSTPVGQLGAQEIHAKTRKFLPHLALRMVLEILRTNHTGQESRTSDSFVDHLRGNRHLHRAPIIADVAGAEWALRPLAPRSLLRRMPRRGLTALGRQVRFRLLPTSPHSDAVTFSYTVPCLHRTRSHTG